MLQLLRQVPEWGEKERVLERLQGQRIETLQLRLGQLRSTDLQGWQLLGQLLLLMMGLAGGDLKRAKVSYESRGARVRGVNEGTLRVRQGAGQFWELVEAPAQSLQGT